MEEEKNVKDGIRFLGRTLWNSKLGATFFNWTGSGFELEFCGEELIAEFLVKADFYPAEGVNLPWITVLVDGKPDNIIGWKKE